MEFYSNWTPDNDLIAEGKLLPDNKGFIHEQIHNYGSSANKSVLAHQVMNYYTEDQVPVLTSLVKNYLTFNHWHSDIAGVSKALNFLLVFGHKLTVVNIAYLSKSICSCCRYIWWPWKER
jgi:phospholipase C